MSRRSGTEQGFRTLLSYIQSELEFESGFYNDAYLDRRITARMRRTDTDSYRAYRRLLEREREERTALLDSLSINVTGFFRDPEAWEALRGVLRTLSDQSGRIDAWSAPCADGREPYSLAMLAHDDPQVDGDRLDILATDINEETLRTARWGTYETSQTTDIEDELEPLSNRYRYVQRDGDRFQVRERIRDHVTFRRHDLIRGDPRPGTDLVLCRNLLIYIDSSYKESILETVVESLADDGYLMIGMTETVPPRVRNAFEPVDKQHRIYRKP